MGKEEQFLRSEEGRVRRKDIRPGKVYTDQNHVGQRIVTRKTRDTVYYIAVRLSLPGFYARPLGGGHCSLSWFVEWASREVK